MEEKVCLLCDEKFTSDMVEDKGHVGSGGETTITDCYCLSDSEICEGCRTKPPEQVVRELKARGQMPS